MTIGIRTYKFVMLLLVSLILMAGCKTTFKVVNNERILFEQSVLQEVSDEFLSFSTFSTKVKIDGSFLDKKKPLKGAIRIRRDSIVWISVNLASGIPIAKMSFTKDSVKILDRIKDELYLGDYNYVNTRFNLNLNYQLIESIILNEFAICEGLDSISIDREIIEHSGLYGIKCSALKAEDNNFSIDYNVNKNSKKIEAANFIVAESEYNVVYSDFNLVEEKLFPGLVSYVDDSREPALSIEIDMSKISLNKRLRYPFKISKKITIINK